MNENRVRMLRATITWREITDSDLANCDIESFVPLNDDVIFPRNAVKLLFNYYYRDGDEPEITNFARLIENYMAADSYYCLFYGREFRKILTFLQRQGRTARARVLLERSLRSLGVLRGNGLSLCIGSFAGGDYSYSWPVIFFDTYMKLLVRQGDIELAKTLLRQSLDAGCLRDDAIIMLDRTLGSLEKRKPRYDFPVMMVKKSRLDAQYLGEPTIELVALAFLQDELQKDGVVAGVDLWRLIPDLVRTELPSGVFQAAYAEVTGASAPDSFQYFLQANRSLLSRALAASTGATFGAVGYPDLIMYDDSNLSDLLLIEVKDVHDRLRPHQEAVLNRFVEAGIPCRLLKFAP
ncbi:VRR-NUC domain-containing protein [Candidatus Bipolaricaulota bacterium]|nr:VRR-NUC domain-containing protein [Candidatus Bipolaricaulota bacterium]